MSSHDWHVLLSFGLLTAALAMYDPHFAVLMIGVASAVTLVKNADAITEVLHA